MGRGPGARVMGTWRNSIPHPSIPSVGWKAQSQWEHHFSQAGPVWSHGEPLLVALARWLCSITLHSPPSLRSLLQVWSPSTTKPTVTYSVTNSAPKPCAGSSVDLTPWVTPWITPLVGVYIPKKKR